MTISDNLIRELISVMKESFGAELSFEDAKEVGDALVSLYLLIEQLPN